METIEDLSGTSGNICRRILGTFVDEDQGHLSVGIGNICSWFGGIFVDKSYEYFANPITYASHHTLSMNT